LGAALPNFRVDHLNAVDQRGGAHEIRRPAGRIGAGLPQVVPLEVEDAVDAVAQVGPQLRDIAGARHADDGDAFDSLALSGEMKCTSDLKKL
jgi:hypothetical protein